MADKYTLRRSILDAVRASEPACAHFDDVVEFPVIAMNAALTPDVVFEALKGLVACGYLVDLAPGRAPLYRVTVKGRLQADRETDLDEYIWGEYASRFAAGGAAHGG
jgi:hypothetical protein